jgi:hypothetical protein
MFKRLSLTLIVCLSILNFKDEAVQWVRQLVAGLSPRKPGFSHRLVHLGFVVDEVVLEQVFLRVLRVFSCQYHSIIPQWLSILIYHLGDER